MDEDTAVDALAGDYLAGTLDERRMRIVTVGYRLGRMIYMPDQIDDFGFTDEEKRQVNAVMAAVMRADQEMEEEARKRQMPARRKAMALLRSYLTPEQITRLRRSRAFLAVGSGGGVYRLDPYHGRTERVERHGRKWFATRSFCLHDYAEDAPDRSRIPLGDLALQHLLLLSADEPAFLGAANASRRDDMLWNGDWLRRVRRPRPTEVAA